MHASRSFQTHVQKVMLKMKNNRSFSRTLLSLLTALGCSILFVLCTYGITVFFSAMMAEGASSLLRLLCALLGLLLYPGAIALGLGLVPLTGLITKNDLRGQWLLMLLMGASIFCYGHLILTGNAGLVTFPSFLQSIHQTFASQPDGSGVYLMLFGGSLFFCLIYTTQRIFLPVFFPKLLLYLALPLTVVVPLANYATNIDDRSFWHILSYPALILVLLFCVGAGLFTGQVFALNRKGRLLPFFWLMYLFTGVLLLFGLFLSVGVFFDNLPYRLARNFLPDASYKVLKLFDDLCAFWCGLGFIAVGLCGLLGTIAVHSDRCPHCGGYGLKSSKDLGVDDTYLSGHYSTTESTWTKSRIYSDGWHRDSYKDTEYRYSEYTEKGKDENFCRFCHRSCGVESYTRKFGKLIDSKDAGKHDEWHFM